MLINCDLADLSLEISVQDVRDLIENSVPILMVDVREPGEFAIARIEGAELIPMRNIPQRIMDLEDRDESLIIMCHHGMRSLQVAAWLREHGVGNAQSMAGGLDAWSRLIDPAVPRY